MSENFFLLWTVSSVIAMYTFSVIQDTLK